MNRSKCCSFSSSVLLLALAASAWADEPWTVVGATGVVRYVIVPTAAARDREAYQRQIQQLCVPERSCFLNFFTNTRGETPVLPLPDAIDKEATAVFRRSTKQGAEMLRWSCRMQLADGDCF